MLSALVVWVVAALSAQLASGATDGALHTLSSEERLIGWKGDSYRPTWKLRPEMIRTISWQPRAFVYHNFITDAEARHIADLAAITMKRSTVVGENGSSVVDDYRTSYGTFINRRYDKVITAIQERVALWIRVPASHQEDMQVLRYANGQYYHQHMDSLEDDSPRLATVLIYLSDPEVGGETAFPASTWSNPQLAARFGPFSRCVKRNVAFKPRRGDALLFWSVNLDGKTQDPHSEHEGCPVEKGVKWTTTIWTHTVPYRLSQWKEAMNRTEPEEVADPGVCKDTTPRCKSWAAAGECTKNAAYMDAACRASCKACEACKDDDRECYRRNRERGGYLLYDPAELTSAPHRLDDPLDTASDGDGDA